MNNPLSNIDTAQFESAVGNAIEVMADRLTDVTATLADVTELLGERVQDDVIPAARKLGGRVQERVHDDVVPAAREGAERTQSFVRSRPRVSIAAVAGVAFAVALLVWLTKRGNDEETASSAEERTGPRSVA